MRFWEGSRPTVLGRISVTLVLTASGACSGPVEQGRSLGGDPARGRTVVAAIECGACHHIPGVAGADGIVGPSLAGFAERALVAGVLPNQPALLARWVREAPSLVPGTGMPDLPISEADSHDVAAFLYSLR